MTLTLERDGQFLVLSGAVLFLLGLLQGVVIELAENPRMALSAHLAAVQSGMALMIAGAVWSAVRLARPWRRLSSWTMAIGIYAVWAGMTVSALTGASGALPHAGRGYAAGPVAEGIVYALVLIGGGLTLVGWALFTLGLARRSLERGATPDR